MSDTAARILVVDDTALIRAMAEALLRGAGYDVRCAADGAGAAACARQWRPHVVLLDLVLDGEDGWDVLPAIREAAGDGTRVLICTGDEDVAEDDATTRGADGLVRKPFSADSLLRPLEAILGSVA